MGANKDSIFFYPKIKGELEYEINFLNFENIQIFQPPSLIRQAELMRSGERIGVKLFQTLSSFGILKSLKPIDVSDLAYCMIVESKSFKFKLNMKLSKFEQY